MSPTKRTPITRTPIPHDLAKSIAAVLIYGWGTVPQRTQYRAGASPLDVYLIGENELRAAWHQHRAFIEDEAARLGLEQPWAATYFDDDDDA